MRNEWRKRAPLSSEILGVYFPQVKANACAGNIVREINRRDPEPVAPIVYRSPEGLGWADPVKTDEFGIHAWQLG